MSEWLESVLILAGGVTAWAIILGTCLKISLVRERKREEKARAKRLCWDIEGLNNDDFRWLCRWSFDLTDPDIARGYREYKPREMA